LDADFVELDASDILLVVVILGDKILLIVSLWVIVYDLDIIESISPNICDALEYIFSSNFLFLLYYVPSISILFLFLLILVV
jgi:hypothetical protein